MDNIRDEIEKLEGCQRKLVDTALKSKLQKYKKQGGYEHLIYDAFIFNKIRDSFGGRLRTILSGGAQLDEDVHANLSVLLSASFLVIYGLAESTSICFLNSMLDCQTGIVGGPWANTEFRLEDVP